MVSSSRAKSFVELRHLQTFLLVAEELSFSRAAERLGVSQPPLSRQIKRLEAQLNVQLFDRSHAQVRLTAAGRVFAKSARRIIEQMERGIHEAQLAAEGLTGELIVGIDGKASACDDMIRFMSAYQLRFPQVRLQLKELTAQEQLRALQAEEISLGFVEPWGVDVASAPDVNSHSVVQDSLSVVLPAFHSLATLSELSLLDVAGEDAVMGERWQRYVSAIAQKEHLSFTPHIVQLASEHRLILSFVALGRGLSILPSATEHKMPYPGITYRRLQPAMKVNVLSAIWRCDETRPTMTALVQALTQKAIGQDNHYTHLDRN